MSLTMSNNPAEGVQPDLVEVVKRAFLDHWDANDAAQAAIAAARPLIEAEIVAWLRGEAEKDSTLVTWDILDAIERGEHRK